MPQLASRLVAMPAHSHCASADTYNDEIAQMRSGVLIKEEIKELGLIQAPSGGQLDERCFKPASFDLRLGGECVYPDKGRGTPRAAEDCTNGEVVIKPFASVVVSTYEIVHMPLHVVGKFNLRIKLAMEGLIVQMGTQVEPGYQGPLFAMLQNISDHEIRLRYCDFETRPFTIEFTYTSRPVEESPDSSKRIGSIKQIMPRYSAYGTINTITSELKAAQDELKSSSLGKLSLKAAAYFALMTLIITFLASSVPAWVTSQFVKLTGEDVDKKVVEVVKNYDYKDIFAKFGVQGITESVIDQKIERRIMELENQIKAINGGKVQKSMIEQ